MGQRGPEGDGLQWLQSARFVQLSEHIFEWCAHQLKLKSFLRFCLDSSFTCTALFEPQSDRRRASSPLALSSFRTYNEETSPSSLGT